MFDAQTFKDTFLPCHKQLYITAYRLLNNRAEAEDTVQDVYVKLWNIREKLTGIDNPQAYATTMIRNLCLDRLRSPARRTSQKEAAETLKSEWVDTAAQMDQKDELKMVIRLVDRLPERQREIFKLRHFSEFSLKEIEQITGLNPVNIRVHLTRAQKNIRQQYDKMNRHGYQFD
jgi:RNA polymerase sigma-70 factor, ECF subfamily